MEPREALAAVAKELAAAVRATDAEEVAALAEAVAGAREVFVTGQGRSGFVARGFAMRLAQLGLKAHFVGEPTTGPIKRRDLLVVASGSGETPSCVAAACAAQQAGAMIALVTIRPDSTLGGMAGVTVRIGAPSPKAGQVAAESVQPLGSLFEQALLAVLDTTVLVLMARLGETAEGMFARHANLE